MRNSLAPLVRFRFLSDGPHLQGTSSACHTLAVPAHALRRRDPQCIGLTTGREGGGPGGGDGVVVVDEGSRRASGQTPGHTAPQPPHFKPEETEGRSARQARPHQSSAASKVSLAAAAISIIFDATKVSSRRCLSQQTRLLPRRDKNMFVATKLCLSRQTYV